ncbi:MAG: bis(5'-nucleosyl)-tetraphosphatase (symmetrical) YqeK [Candidatus Firestonebacteria bacterium]
MKSSFTETEIKKYLKTNLQPERYRHTLGVISFAEELAEKNGVSIEKTRLAALLHDSGKEIGRHKRYMRHMQFDSFEKRIRPVWHNKLGVVIAKRHFKVRDKGVLSAIRKHSTADKSMSPLDKIIYIADIAERNRKFKDAVIIRRAALKNLNEGFILALAKKIEYVLHKKKIIHPKSIEAWNNYIK